MIESFTFVSNWLGNKVLQGLSVKACIRSLILSLTTEKTDHHIRHLSRAVELNICPVGR